MMRNFCLLLCLFAVLFTNGCASNKNLVVLLPDDEGHVGAVQITNKAGTYTVDQAWQASRIKNAETRPESADSLKKEKILRIFGAALETLPAPPVRFILYFKPESAELSADARKILSEAIDEIRARQSRDVGVIGHTDSTGTEEYNMKLSQERAARVKEILLSEGIPSEDIETNYYGKRDPLVDVGENVPEPRNRRVEIYVR